MTLEVASSLQIDLGNQHTKNLFPSP